MLVTGSTGWTSSDVKSFTIDHAVDILNLKDVSEELCQAEGEVECEIFIKIINKMDVELDITLTLMVK